MGDLVLEGFQWKTSDDDIILSSSCAVFLEQSQAAASPQLYLPVLLSCLIFI
jgi:hypothetical protein